MPAIWVIILSSFLLWILGLALGWGGWTWVFLVIAIGGVGFVYSRRMGKLFFWAAVLLSALIWIVGLAQGWAGWIWIFFVITVLGLLPLVLSLTGRKVRL